jgi:hypothetical protein
VRQHAWWNHLLRLGVALALAAAVRPAAAAPLPAHVDVNVADDVAGCMGLEPTAGQDALDPCCAQCVVQIREVAAFSSSYMTAAMVWRRALLGLSLLGAGAFLGWGYWRSRTLRLRPQWTLAGGLIILVVVAGAGSWAASWATREEGRRLVTADRILRELTRLGLIPTTSQVSHVHCAALIETLAKRGDSKCGGELLTYEGAYSHFDKIDGSYPQLRSEKQRRAEDALRLINGAVRLDVQRQPTSPGEVLRDDELLSAVADARLGWLRYLWFEALLIVAAGAVFTWAVALLVSWLRRDRHLELLRRIAPAG